MKVNAIIIILILIFNMCQDSIDRQPPLTIAVLNTSLMNDSIICDIIIDDSMVISKKMIPQTLSLNVQLEIGHHKGYILIENFSLKKEFSFYLPDHKKYQLVIEYEHNPEKEEGIKVLVDRYRKYHPEVHDSIYNKARNKLINGGYQEIKPTVNINFREYNYQLE